MADAARRVRIVGMGKTRYTKWGQMAGRGEWSLACEAMLNTVTALLIRQEIVRPVCDLA